MVEDPGTRSESLLGVGQRGIHRDQCVIEAAQRIIAQSLKRHGMLRRFDPRWEPAISQDVEAPQMLPEIRLSARGLPSLHGSL